MRKLVGGLLGLLSVLFLGLAYTQFAHAEEPDCSSALAKKIAELEEQDKTGILKLQRQVTFLKLAAQTVSSGNQTVEAYIRKQEDLIQKLNAEVDKADGTTDQNGILDRLITLYEYSGASNGDRDQALNRIALTLEKLPKASYWKKETRFKNEELSAFMMAHSLIHEKKSPFREADSAILWLESEISDGVEKATHRGSAEANLTEASSIIVRFTGVIQNKYTSEELAAALTKTQKTLDEEYDRVVNTYRSDLAKSCAELKNCADCKITQENKDSALVKAIALMKKKYIEDPKFKDKRVQERLLSRARERKLEPELESAETPISQAAEAKSQQSAKEKSIPNRDAPAYQPYTLPPQKNLFVAGDSFVTPSSAAPKTEVSKVSMRRIDSIPVNAKVDAPSVQYENCVITMKVMRKRANVGKFDVHVEYVAKHSTTGAVTNGQYQFPEAPNQLLKDVWSETLGVSAELKKTCPPLVAK